MRRGPSATWWMAILFAGGSACFVVASLPGFVQLVGSAVVGVVYFVGSLQFTSAAAIQWGLTIRRFGLDWWASAIQFVGTLLFNLNTYDAMQEGLDATSYDRLVWTPDVLGSICFLVASYLAYQQSSGGFFRRPQRGRESVIATANLVGSIAFGVAAIAAYWTPTSGSVLDLAAANGFTALGGLCFLAGALLLLPRHRTRRDQSELAERSDPDADRGRGDPDDGAQEEDVADAQHRLT